MGLNFNLSNSGNSLHCNNWQPVIVDYMDNSAQTQSKGRGSSPAPGAFASCSQPHQLPQHRLQSKAELFPHSCWAGRVQHRHSYKGTAPALGKGHSDLEQPVNFSWQENSLALFLMTTMTIPESWACSLTGSLQQLVRFH